MSKALINQMKKGKKPLTQEDVRDFLVAKNIDVKLWSSGENTYVEVEGNKKNIVVKITKGGKLDELLAANPEIVEVVTAALT